MSDSQILLPGDHISWTYLLPNLRIWKVQEAPSFAAWRAAPSVPLCLLFCLEGGIQIVLEHGQTIDVTPQDILLLSPAAPVQEISQTDASQHGYIVLEGKESLPSFLNYWSVPYSQLQEKDILSRLQAHGGWLLFPKCLWSNAFFAQLEDLPREAQGEYCALKSIELLFLLCNHSLHPLEFHGRRYWDQDQMEAIRQTHDYILTHLSQPLTIDSLARRFHISGTFLKEGFRQMYGQSTRKFLQANRMDLASDLLRRTDQSVLQIAAAVGYESASQFSQIFKRHYKLPPAQYRRQWAKRNV